MADFKELTASRVSGVKGFNATSESRVVRVIAEEADLETGTGPDGPFTRYPDPRDLVEAQWARLGSGHPWEPDTLRAGSYRILEHRGQGQWLVEVVYLRNDVSIGFPPIDKWLIRYRGATVTQHTLTELEPEGNGTGTDLWNRPSAEVGSPAFKKVPPTSQATHWARTVDDEGNIGHQTLKLIPDLTEEPRGMTVEDPAWLVTYERTIPNFVHQRLPRSVAPYLKAVNSVIFQGADPSHVKCLDITLDPIAAVVPGQRTDGVAYHAMISFLWSHIAFSPHKIVPSWYDSDGHRATVFIGIPESTTVDVAEFRNVRRADMNLLLYIMQRGW